MPIVYSKNPSRNRKIARLDTQTGAPVWPYVYATYREVGTTCHKRCGFHPDHADARIHGRQCYALTGRVALHQRRGTPDASDGDTMRTWIRTLPPQSAIRVHVSGDFYRRGGDLDRDYFEALCAALELRPDVTAWTYTHAPMVDWLWMRERAPDNFAVNWSTDSLEDARAAQSEGRTGLTAVVAPDADREKGVTICPEQTSGISCADCQLCWKVDRKTIVGFLAH